MVMNWLLVAVSRFDDPAIITQARAVVITVGTPLHTHIETDLDQIRANEGASLHLRRGHLLCLRSTVAPGTTRFVRKWIERRTEHRIGHDIFLHSVLNASRRAKPRELRTYTDHRG